MTSEEWHTLRNRISILAAATETVRTLDRAGRLDLSHLPGLRAQLEDCHWIVQELARVEPGREVAGGKGGAP